MNRAFEFVDTLSAWVWETSWQASLLAVVIIAAQAILGSRLTARWRYALWLLVLIRLVLPTLPESRASIYNWTPSRLPFASIEIPPVPRTPLHPSPPAFAPPVESSNLPLSPNPSPAISIPWLALIWLTGAALFIASGLFRYLTFWRRVGRTGMCPSPLLDSLLQEAKGNRGLRHVRLLVTRAIESPAVGGLFSPVILIPANMEDRLEAQEMRLVLLHELSHVRRFDVFTAWAFWFFGALHWFNPILHLAFRRARLDRELACDEDVLSSTHDTHAYGSALLRLWESHLERSRPLGIIGIFENRSESFRRMTHISAFRRPSLFQSMAGLFVLAAIALRTLTGQIGASAKKPEAVAKTGFVTSLIETEFQMIAVPNSAMGSLFLPESEKKIHQSLIDLLGRGVATVFDVTKAVAENGTRGSALGLSRVEVEYLLLPDLQSLYLNMTLQSEKSKLALSASLPAGQTLCLGSFDDPRQGYDATVFVFAKWKIIEL